MEIHRERVLRSKWVFWRWVFFLFQSTVSKNPQLGRVGGKNLGLRTSKVDISERMSRTSRAAWRFVFGSVMLDWGMAVAVCGLGITVSKRMGRGQLCHVLCGHMTV